MKKQTLLFILGIFSLQNNISGESKPFHSGFSKRSLLTFPPSSLLQVNMGITLTGDFERNSASVALAFQQFASLPEETQLSFIPSVIESGKKFSINHHLRDVISSYGFNGSDCLRKMVCQIGKSPLGDGLLEDIVTLVLTPSRHRNISSNDAFDSSLLESEEFGKKGGNCTFAYSKCFETPLDLISTFIHF